MIFFRGQYNKPTAFKNSGMIVRESPVTGEFVKNITGIEDKDTIRIIQSTGANREDVIQAYENYFEMYHTKSVFMKPMNIFAQQVYDIFDYICLVPE